MLQAAFGGYTLIEDNSTVFIDSLTYYEPGFNLMSPLEISVPKSDSIFILIRKRDSSGVGFENNLIPTNLSITAKDATNGEPLSISSSTFSTRESWNEDPSSNTPILFTITNQIGSGDALLRVRVIDCEVKDTTDNSFINFRIIVEEDPTDLHFNYIPVSRTTYADRNTFTAASRAMHMTLRSDSDAYIIVSPYAWVMETTKDLSDFSYPPDASYYKRETTYNSEDLDFSFQSSSHTFVEDNVSVVNIPGYKKVGLILIDNAIYNSIKELKRSINFTVSVSGELSGMEDTFTVNLYT
jgi:hypothetical protein